MYKVFAILLFGYGLAVTTDDIYDNSWAVIIGINEYEHVDQLNYAVQDAKEIRNLLSRIKLMKLICIHLLS